MKHFVFYSEHAPTTGNFGQDLMKAGRLDVTLHALIAAFFVSNNLREDVVMHLIFDGKPTPPRHLEMYPAKGGVDISKKDLLTLIKKMLYKYKEGKKHEVEPGYFIERKGLLDVVAELSKDSAVFVLDANGSDIRTAKLSENVTFILGDHDGIPRKLRRELLKTYPGVSVGPYDLFASQVITIVHNELDRKK